MKVRMNPRIVVTRFLFTVFCLIVTGILIPLLFPSGTAVAQPRSIGPSTASSATGRLAVNRYFPEPLLWVGVLTPTEVESRLLEEILESGKQRGSFETTQELEEFLDAVPDSPWAASLRSNLGYYYRVRGQYTRALEHWRAVWEATRHFEDGAGRRIADYTLIHWTQLLASLGRVEELEEV
jgi:tetratricopeptide (TPR) repeat protein